MTKKNRQSDSERKREMWQARVKAWQRSGLLQHEYCRRNNLSSRQFSYWKKVLGLEHGQRAGSFVPVPIPKIMEAPPVSAAGTAITVRLASGIGIELTPEFNATTLVRAVAALGGGV